MFTSPRAQRTHESPVSGSATAEPASVVLGATCGAACRGCSSAVAGPKAAAAAAAAVFIDSSVDQNDWHGISSHSGFPGVSCSAGFSGSGGSSVYPPPTTAAWVRDCGFADFGAAGRRRWNTSLASGPAAGTRRSISRCRMRPDLTCNIQMQKK
jgi:hypothetical protein